MTKIDKTTEASLRTRTEKLFKELEQYTNSHGMPLIVGTSAKKGIGINLLRTVIMHSTGVMYKENLFLVNKQEKVKQQSQENVQDNIEKNTFLDTKVQIPNPNQQNKTQKLSFIEKMKRKESLKKKEAHKKIEKIQNVIRQHKFVFRTHYLNDTIPRTKKQKKLYKRILKHRAND